MGYTLGFLIVVLGSLQLFTESTLSAALPVATHPSRRNTGRLLRLWVLVFMANMAGTMLIACLNNYGLIGAPEHRTAMLALSRRLFEHDFGETVKLAIPAGFLMAAVPWVMPSSKGQQFWVVFVLTYFIAVGGFAHVVASSGEAWLLAFANETSFGHAAFGMILPALIGTRFAHLRPRSRVRSQHPEPAIVFGQPFDIGPPDASRSRIASSGKR